MNRLVAVELRRFFARRLIVLAMVGAVLLTGFQLVGVWQQAQPPSAAEEAQAREFYETELAHWEENGEQMVADCVAAEEQEREATGRVVDFGCDQLAPRLEHFLWEPPALTETLPAGLSGLGTLLMAMALLAGGTSVAAEHTSGSLSTWLTFVPRRTGVYASKVAAAALGVLPAAALALAVFAAGAWLINDAAGLTDGFRAAHWSDAAGTAGRIAAACALAAAAGAALGFLLRHTAAVLGLAVGWMVVVENVLAFNLFGGRLQPWLLSTNLRAFVQGGTTWGRDECATRPEGLVCEWVEHEISLGQGVGVVLGVAAALTALGLVVFRRRDLL